MKLKHYLEAERGNAAWLARQIGTAPETVSFWKNGRRAVPVRHCLAIVKATGGKVTVQDLRPHDWQLYWS